MQPFNVSTSPVPPVGEHELGVGTGASIVMAVAASLVAFLALLVAAHAAPASAAPLAEAAPAGENHALAAIMLVAVIAGWSAATVDLWRSLFNRVRRWTPPHF